MERTRRSRQRGGGLTDRVERALGRLGAECDRLLGAVELEQADPAEPRIDEHVGRIAGEARPSDAVLNDVEGVDHHRVYAGACRRAYHLALKQPLGAEHAAQTPTLPSRLIRWVVIGVRPMVVNR